ncbi:hypothetical protein L6452_03482 [Arctium lappa]|uniref:Uncharacterized protein n=1 Tax=Arctium lappa TaxID=4217 RepID=A0ACB9FNC8_ARCLA|nr:hypothetical protein L6452_03482 [Arctium lappa]
MEKRRKQQYLSKDVCSGEGLVNRSLRGDKKEAVGCELYKEAVGLNKEEINLNGEADLFNYLVGQLNLDKKVMESQAHLEFSGKERIGPSDEFVGAQQFGSDGNGEGIQKIRATREGLDNDIGGSLKSNAGKRNANLEEVVKSKANMRRNLNVVLPGDSGGGGCTNGKIRRRFVETVRRPSCLPSRQDSKAVRPDVVGVVCSGVTGAEELLDTIGRFSSVCLLQHCNEEEPSFYKKEKSLSQDVDKIRQR